MEKTIARQGVQVAYEALPGSRALTIVLVHGYGVHREMWRPQVEYLQGNQYPIINIDVRGHGKSRPTLEFSVPLAADDIRAVVEAEKPEKYMMCGLSMGALVAQEYALRHGEAAGYMLTGTTPLLIPYAKWEKILMEWSGPMMKYLYTWQGLKRAMSKGSACTQAARLALAKLFDDMNKAEFLLSWRGFSTCLHEAPHQFDAPLLVAAGQHDNLGTIQKHLPDWAAHYPACRVETLPNAGHVANLDAPARFNALLGDFIARL